MLPIVAQKNSETALRIGDIARLAHKSTRAVRLYEELGLLGPVVRTEGGHRSYSEDVLRRIAWIEKLQTLGFSLSQIGKLLEKWSGSEFGPEAMIMLRELFEQKLEETRAQLKTMETLALELTESLRYLSSCEVCDPETLLGTCKSCEEPHVTSTAPDLVSGFYTDSSEQTEALGIEDR
jgi:DNA-binding transcriptional MerR regulator